MSTLAAGWNEEALYVISERAYLLHTEGRFRESLAIFDGLLELFPDNLYVRDAVSALHLCLGNAQEAIRHASGVISLAPKYITAFLRRGEAYLLLGMISEAERDLQRLRDLGAYGASRRMEMRLMAVRKKQTAPSRQRFTKLETRAATSQLYRARNDN